MPRGPERTLLAAWAAPRAAETRASHTRAPVPAGPSAGLQTHCAGLRESKARPRAEPAKGTFKGGADSARRLPRVGSSTPCHWAAAGPLTRPCPTRDDPGGSLKALTHPTAGKGWEELRYRQRAPGRVKLQRIFSPPARHFPGSSKLSRNITRRATHRSRETAGNFSVFLIDLNTYSSQISVKYTKYMHPQLKGAS